MIITSIIRTCGIFLFATVTNDLVLGTVVCTSSFFSWSNHIEYCLFFFFPQLDIKKNQKEKKKKNWIRFISPESFSRKWSNTIIWFTPLFRSYMHTKTYHMTHDRGQAFSDKTWWLIFSRSELYKKVSSSVRPSVGKQVFSRLHKSG